MATTFNRFNYQKINIPLISFSFLTSVSASASTITIPTTIQNGDFAILQDQAATFAGIGTVSQVIPSGFTRFAGATVASGTSSSRADISYRVLDANDPGRVLTGMNAFAERKLLAIFRPSYYRYSQNFSILDIANEGPVATAPVNQTININGETRPIIAFAHYSSIGAVTTRGFSGGGVTATELATGTECFMKYAIFNTSNNITSNITVSQSDDGTNGLNSYYIKFTDNI